jgi:hypothetical protein
MKPIPKKLLIHTVTVVSDISKETWGNETPGAETVISHVRIEPRSELVIGKQNRQVKLSGLMFYDMVNSSPAHDFSEIDKIDFHGNRYNIAFIKELFDASKLHHLEIGLML